MGTWRLSGCIGLLVSVSAFPAFGTSTLTLAIRDGNDLLFPNLTSSTRADQLPVALGEPDVEEEGPQIWKFQFDPSKGILGMRTDSGSLSFNNTNATPLAIPVFVPELQLTPAQFESVLLNTRTYVAPYQLQEQKLTFFSWNGNSAALNVWDFGEMDAFAADPPLDAPEPTPLLMIVCGFALIAAGAVRGTSRTNR